MNLFKWVKIVPEIFKLFPTAVYYEEDIISEEYNETIIDCCYRIQKVAESGGKGWFTNVYNTLKTHDVVHDKNFEQLNQAVETHIQKFVKTHGSDEYYPLDNGWLNIYQKNDYQEYHYHTDSVISAVYYAKMPKNSGGLILNSPKEPDMLPIQGITENNEFNHTFFKIFPKERSLVIFRSSVQHMVEPGQNECERISVAYNSR